MPTYVFRCDRCKIDWQRFFKMADKAEYLFCPTPGCGNGACQQVITAVPVIFKAAGFPGNDMKHLTTGKSIGTVGDKLTHSDMEYVEKMYPNVHDTNTEQERFMDTTKVGSKTKDFGKR